MMMPLNVQEQKQMEMLKSQVDSLFKVFKGILGIVNSNTKNKKELLGHNDYAVSMMSVFGATCQSYRAEKQIRVLQATHGYFEERGDALSGADMDFLAPWLQYMRCALVSSAPLPILDISSQSHELASKGMTRNINGFMSTLLGTAHRTAKQKKDIDTDPVQYADRNEKLIQSSKKRLGSRHSHFDCTDQNGMYFMSGGGQNIKFGKKTAFKPNKGMDYYRFHSRPPSVSITNISISISRGSSGRDKHRYHELPHHIHIHKGMDIDDGKDCDYDIPNACVTGGPMKMKISGTGMEFDVRYPLPCKVVGEQGGRYEVVFANPFGANGEMEVSAKCLEFDRKKVKKAEEDYLRRFRPRVETLGYPAIKDLF